MAVKKDTDKVPNVNDRILKRLDEVFEAVDFMRGEINFMRAELRAVKSALEEQGVRIDGVEQAQSRQRHLHSVNGNGKADGE